MQEDNYSFAKIGHGARIEETGLSVRCVNSLHREGIFYLSQMLTLTEEDMMKIRNLGAKSVRELLKAKEFYLAEFGIADQSSETAQKKSEIPKFLFSDGTWREDIEIKKIGFSNRAYNCLHREGYQFASQLLGVTEEKLLTIRNMGKQTAEEIIQKIRNLDFPLFSAQEEPEANAQPDRLAVFCQELSDAFGILPQILYSSLQKKQEEAGILFEGESLYYHAYELPILQSALREKIHALLYEAAFTPITREKLDEQLPHHLFNTTITNTALIDLENEGKIRETDEGYYLFYPRCMEYAASIEKENERLCLTERLKGRTLEEIGQENGWTRERVRQLMEKALNHRGRPRLHEDQYVYFFDTYYIQKEDFCTAFREPPEAYEYLSLTVKKKADAKEDVENALTDSQIPEKWKRRLHKLIYRNYVLLDGQPVKIDRYALVNHAIRKFAQNKIGYDEFTALYLAWLEELGLGEREDLRYNLRSYENRIGALNCVLWNYKSSFRYYDISAVDADAFLKEIDLRQYKDLAITTLLIFRSHPEVMEEYDIRDEYELHNLLRKLDAQARFPELDIDYKKMPTLIFGNGNAENQTLDLLIETAPILQTELAALYEERYGIKKETAMGSLFSCIDSYFYKGMYSISEEGLNLNEQQILKDLLTDDFYLKKDISGIYKTAFPNGNPQRINNYSLKTLGFHVYESYVVSERFRSAADYFDHLLLDHPITDMNEMDTAFSGITLYSSELIKLKAARKIVEFSPKQYITLERLNECGITLADIERYCDDVAALTDEGDFFTLRSLRNFGFSDELDDYGFDDWFYSSLLREDREHFSYRRVANSCLFCRGAKTVQLSDFFVSIMLKEQQMDIYDFCELLERQYGLSIDIYKVRSIVGESGMYYNPIMEKIYIDYETYYEEV